MKASVEAYASDMPGYATVNLNSKLFISFYVGVKPLSFSEATRLVEEAFEAGLEAGIQYERNRIINRLTGEDKE